MTPIDNVAIVISLFTTSCRSVVVSNIDRITAIKTVNTSTAVVK